MRAKESLSAPSDLVQDLKRHSILGWGGQVVVWKQTGKSGLSQGREEQTCTREDTRVPGRDEMELLRSGCLGALFSSLKRLIFQLFNTSRSQSFSETEAHVRELRTWRSLLSQGGGIYSYCSIDSYQCRCSEMFLGG